MKFSLTVSVTRKTSTFRIEITFLEFVGKIQSQQKTKIKKTKKTKNTFWGTPEMLSEDIQTKMSSLTISYPKVSPF